MICFSVLMSVYHKEISSSLNQCLESLLNQTVPATEIVIVKDGILTVVLESVIAEWQDKLPLKIVGYEENKGLAHALNYGLNYCSYELVARMDSDDICMPDRFEKQIGYFEKNKEADLLSGYISEFNERPNDIISIRTVPIGNSAINKFLRKRNAFNHMAVMFKKSAIFSVGGYQGINGFEDYDLWIRLVQAEYKVDNLAEILVYVRIGNDMIGRRQGWGYAKVEYAFFRKLLNTHFLSLPAFLYVCIFKISMRLLPKTFLQFVYRIMRNKKSP